MAKNRIDIYDVKRSDFIFYLMALHFGLGRWHFDALAIVFSITLALFYLSRLLIIKFDKYKTSL